MEHEDIEIMRREARATQRKMRFEVVARCSLLGQEMNVDIRGRFIRVDTALDARRQQLCEVLMNDM
jgi:hypothetical protein